MEFLRSYDTLYSPAMDPHLQKMLSWRTLVFCFYEEERAPPKARGKAESRAGRRQTTLVAYS